MFSPREMEEKDIVGAGMHFSDVENSSSGNEIFCVEMHWNIFPPSQISIYQQEDEEVPIYRSPNILFCSFWKNEVLIKRVLCGTRWSNKLTGKFVITMFRRFVFEKKTGKEANTSFTILNSLTVITR